MPFPPRTCPVCGASFVPRRHNSLYCRACADAVRHVQDRARKRGAAFADRETLFAAARDWRDAQANGAVCRVCGARFFPGHSKAVYCPGCRPAVEVARSALVHACADAARPPARDDVIRAAIALRPRYLGMRARSFRKARALRKICPVCGLDFVASSRKVTVCQACRGVVLRVSCQKARAGAPLRTPQARIEAARLWMRRTERAAAQPSRRCHDCGAPCNDYRCEACWKKFRTRYAVECADEDV